MNPERIAQELRLHNAWRRGEGVFDGETPAPMPHTPKELGEIIEVAAAYCERVQLLAKALQDVLELHPDENCSWAKYIAHAALVEAGIKKSTKDGH